MKSENRIAIDQNSAMSIAHRFARFAERLRDENLPDAVNDAAKLHLLDALGVGLAAASVQTRPRIEQAVKMMGSGGEATGLGLREPLPAPAAALLNGSLVHALEFDDTHMGAVVHASAVAAPVTLAVAESVQCSGAELLKAFTLGWEAMARIGLASPSSFHARGFQSTAVMGAPVAALVAGSLLNLDARAMTHAMGISGSQAGGIFEFVRDGSNVKMLHGGWPAHAGIMAAALSNHGLTGPSTVFEGERGLYRAFTNDVDAAKRLSAELDDLGRRWLLFEVAFKPYPCCHYLQAAIEALEQIIATGLAVDEIAQLYCELPKEVAWLVCEPWAEKLNPPSGHVAKFSAPYCLAALLVDGKVDVATFDRIEPDTRFAPLMRRMSYRPMADSQFPKRYPARIRIETHTQAVYEQVVTDVRGSPGRPFTRADVIAKFESNASRTLTPNGVSDVISCIDELDGARDLVDLSRALREVA